MSTTTEVETTITLTLSEYRYLVNDSNFLSALQDAGVDNWEGYEIALQIMNGGDDE